MKRFDIIVPKKYTKDGEEKTAWNNVGTLVHFPANGDKDEGYILELNMFPETTFKVFEQKPKEEQAPQQAQQTAPEYPADEINPEDIPF